MNFHEIPKNGTMDVFREPGSATVMRTMAEGFGVLDSAGDVRTTPGNRLNPNASATKGRIPVEPPNSAIPTGAWRMSGARAFTLLELMLVISIMGMLAALMVPAVKGMRKMNDMTVACRQLQDDLGFARQRAITERTTVYVVFIPPSIADVNVMAALRADPDRRSIAMYTNLAKGQFTAYALYADRRLGDQPGQRRPRYLTEWKFLPEGVFIATNKFINLPQTQYRQTPSLRDRPYVVRPFLQYSKDRFRFPHENSTVVLALPYIAFNWQGQLQYPSTSPNDWVPTDRDEVIPLARGSIFTLKAADGRFLPADAVELPRGNSTNTYNRIRVNWLTGRARVERPEIR
jgi:prepilin-type N-terminal cleavage/methylation domain-containing protein